MLTKEEKLRRYLDNLKEHALRQLIVFILNDKENIKFIERQVEEFDKLYSI